MQSSQTLGLWNIRKYCQLNSSKGLESPWLRKIRNTRPLNRRVYQRQAEREIIQLETIQRQNPISQLCPWIAFPRRFFKALLCPVSFLSLQGETWSDDISTVLGEGRMQPNFYFLQTGTPGLKEVRVTFARPGNSRGKIRTQFSWHPSWG